MPVCAAKRSKMILGNLKMREGLDHWPFIAASFALGIGGTLMLVAQSWLAMRRAEARRDRSRGK